MLSQLPLKLNKTKEKIKIIYALYSYICVYVCNDISVYLCVCMVFQDKISATLTATTSLRLQDWL